MFNTYGILTLIEGGLYLCLSCFWKNQEKVTHAQLMNQSEIFNISIEMPKKNKVTQVNTQ